MHFRKKLKQCFEEMPKHKGSFPIHYLEGKDRTSFVCPVIEALRGASFDEMKDDYMVTYQNYYRVDDISDKYSVIYDTNLILMMNTWRVLRKNSISNLWMRFLMSCNILLSENTRSFLSKLPNRRYCPHPRRSDTLSWHISLCNISLYIQNVVIRDC